MVVPAIIYSLIIQAMETDCLVVTQAIRCSTINLSYLGRVIDECKQLLSDLGDRKVILKFVK